MHLICSAWDEEIKYLKPGWETACLGIGYLEAALNLDKILWAGNYSQIIFLGTAGSYSQDLLVGDIVQVRSVGLLNIGTVLKHSYIPKPYPVYFSSNDPSPFISVNCLSSLEITNDKNLPSKIIDYQVENMELYGVAKVASEHNIPWSALLGITNYTNANAHQDWKANHERVSEKLCKAFISKDLMGKL